MDDHVSRILKMLEEGKITAADAEKLISALRTEARPGAAGGPQPQGTARPADQQPGASTGQAGAESERSSKSFEFRWSKKGSFPFDLSDLGRQITDAMRRIDPERIAREARVSVEREGRRWRDRMRGWGAGEGGEGRPENDEDQPAARAVESLEFDTGAGATVHVENKWGDVSVVGDGDKVTVQVEKEAWARLEEEAQAKLHEIKVEAQVHQAADGMPSRLEVRVVTPEGWRDGLANLRLRVPPTVSLDVATNFGEARAEQLSGPVAVHAVSGSIVLASLAAGQPAGDPAARSVRAETISGSIRATTVGPAVSLSSKSGDIHAEKLQHGGELVSVSGDVRATGVEGGRIEAKSVSGDVNVEEVGQSGPIDVAVESVSGDATLARARGTLFLKTVSGDVIATRLDASMVQCQTVSGDVRISLDAPFSGALTCNTVSGDVAASLPETSSFRFTLGTQSGDLHSGYVSGDTSRTDTLWTGTVGAGAGTVSVQTRSGDVRLDRSDPGA